MALTKRDSIFTSILHYATSTLFQKFLGIFTAFIRPKLLSPELFGLWSLLSVLPNYASYLHLGSRSALRYLVPLHESRGDEGAITASKAAVLYGTLVPTLVFSLALLLAALLWNINTETRIGLLAIAVVVVLNWRFDYLIAVLKSHQQFRLISRYFVVAAVMRLAFTAGLIYALGFYGALLAVVLTAAFSIFYLQRLQAFPSPPRFQFSVFKALVQTGFPIVLFNLIFELLRTADRFVLFFLLGEETVGYYGIGIMVLGLAISIPAVSREVVEPKLMENLDKATLANNIERFMTRPLMNTAYLMPFVIGPSILLLPPVVHVLLPNYAPGITAAQILLIGGYFLATTHAMRGIIVAQRLQFKAALVAFFILLVNVFLSVAAVRLGYGIEGVAAASSLSFLMMFASLLTFVWWQMRREEHGMSTRFYWFFVPFPVMCLLLFIGSSMLGDGMSTDVYRILTQFVFFMVLQGALFVLVRHWGVVAFEIDTR